MKEINIISKMLGLPGSYKWAVKKMKRGQIMISSSNPKIVYRYNHKYNTIEWKFSSTMNWKKDVPGPIELNSVWKIL